MTTELLKILDNPEYTTMGKAVQVSLLVEQMVERRMKQERIAYQQFLKNYTRKSLLRKAS